MEEKKDDRSFMLKLATFIVDKRNGVFLAFIGMIVFSIIASGWVQVCNDITQYLPSESETRQGLTLMENEVTTYATARVMISNISREHAARLAQELEQIEGISAAEFLDAEADPPLTAEDIAEHYVRAAALIDVTFEGEEGDEICESAMAELKAKLDGCDLYISSPVGSSEAALSPCGERGSRPVHSSSLPRERAHSQKAALDQSPSTSSVPGERQRAPRGTVSVPPSKPQSTPNAASALRVMSM